MPTHRLDDGWFMAHRERLLSPPRSLSRERMAALVRGLLENSRLSGAVSQETARALGFLAPRHAGAARAHLQFFRACLETTGLVPSDALVNAAVQVEWLWYTTPFKPFYRDHLAHVMKVARTALWLLEDPGSPLTLGGAPGVEWISERLAEGTMGADALRAAALWCGNSMQELKTPVFWKHALSEATRLAGLLHDMAYPDIMRDTPFQQMARQVAERAVAALAPHLVMSPFHQRRMPGPLPLNKKSREVAQSLFMESHSLRGAHSLLGFMEASHRASGLSPLDAFIMEWAALAIALHDYDKLFELAEKPLPSKKEQLYQEWLLEPGGQNKQAIRPRFEADPVSYLVALADQLQDFGRMSYRPAASEEEQRSAADLAALRLSYPCEAVELEFEGAPPGVQGHVHFIFGAEEAEPFGTAESGAWRAVRQKMPEGKPEPTFGPRGWLDHAGLFANVTVAVSHSPGPEPLRSTRPTAPGLSVA